MSIRCSQVIQILKKLAPEDLAQDWDNVGLLVGSFSKDIDKVLVTLDVTPQVVDEAVKKNVDLILSHHPVIFKPLKNLRLDNPQNRMLATLLKHDIAVYCAHTNLDVAINGVSDVLAAKIGLSQVEVLQKTAEEKLYKLVVFVPEDHTQKVRDALGDAGAGFIGNYSHCTFRTPGIGTFKPGEGTNPYIGEQAKLSEVKEDRLETIVPENILSRVLHAMVEAHPYEEVAYDLYPVVQNGVSQGLGRIGWLEQETVLAEFVQLLKQQLEISFLKIVGNLEDKVKRIAVCGGSGGSLISTAHKKGAQVFITGEISYHEAQLAKDIGLALIDAGHWATEVPVLSYLQKYLAGELNAAGEKVEIILSKTKTEPFLYL